MPSLAERALAGPPAGAASAMALLMRLGDGFLPARARGIRATIEWRVDLEGSEERLWMRIDDGDWLVTRDALDPTLAVALSAVDLRELLDRRVSGVDLFLAQRLVVDGDVLLAVRLADFFGLPVR